MFKYNEDQKLRDSKLTFVSDWGNLRHYKGLSGDDLKWMVDNKFADPDERQNDSPGIAEFVEFLQDNPSFTAHGYVVNLERSDYRLSVEGIFSDNELLSPGQLSAFIDFARIADEFNIDSGYYRAWWD